MHSFFRRKKDKKEIISEEIVIDKSVLGMTEKADVIFEKPIYRAEDRGSGKNPYAVQGIEKTMRQRAFEEGGTVRDPYTGQELFEFQKEAKQRYGQEDYISHAAEADHIDPLVQIVNRSKKNPWLTTKDIKQVANHDDNFQIVSAALNRSKSGNTQEQWSQNENAMGRLSQKSEQSSDDISERLRQIGVQTERDNDTKLAKAGAKNRKVFVREAGIKVAIESGGTVATISTINNFVSVMNGEKKADEAIMDIVDAGANSAVKGYVKGASLTYINHTLTSTDSKFLKALGEKNVAGKIITTVSLTGDTVTKWVNSEISDVECVLELGHCGTNYLGAGTGGVIGQALIPIPIVGNAVGSYIGGMMFSGLYDSLTKEIREAEYRRQQEIYMAMVKYYMEQHRREQVQKMIRTRTREEAAYAVYSIIQSGEMRRLMGTIKNYWKEIAEIERRTAELVLVW